MDEDDEFGDLYSDVLQPFKSFAAPLPPPPPPIDINLHSDSFSKDGAAAISRVSNIEPSKLSSPAIDKDLKFDIEDAETDALPAIPGLSMPASEAESRPALATDGDSSGIGVVSDGAMRRPVDGEGDDWDSDSEDEDLKIVLNDNSHDVLIGAERRSRMGDNPDDDDEDDDDDDEEPLVIVTDTDPNQAMEEQLWAEDSLQATEGDGKDASEAGKAGGVGGAGAPPKIGYIGHGYHPFHSQFKYVRPGAAPVPGGSTSAAGTSSGQVRPPMNVGPMAGRGRGEWRPPGMKNASVAQKGFHQGFGTPWGSNTAGRGLGVGLDFTLPSHKTIFEVDIDGFEEKPWRYPGVDITNFFNFGLNEETWKDYCKQLEQHRVETTMQSRIRVYESGRTDQGYDPDLPPELAAATGSQGGPADSSNLVKSDTIQGDSTKGPAHIRPPLPPGRPIPVESSSGERLPSIDTRAPRIRDADAIIEIFCQDSHGDESSAGNGVDQVSNSLPGENFVGDVNNERPDTESSHQAPAQDEPSKRLHDKQEDEISENAIDECSLRSSSPIGDRDTRSPSAEQKDNGAEASKGSDMEEERKMSSGPSRLVVQEDDVGDSKTERSGESSKASSKAKSGSHREYQQLKDSAEEEVIQDRRYARPGSNRKQLDENIKCQSRNNQDRGQETERTRVASKGGRENSYPRMEFDSSYPHHSNARGENFDKRKERDVVGSVWRRRDDDAYSRRSGDEGSRKRDRGDDLGSRHRGKMRESDTRGEDAHVPSKKHLDDGGMRVPVDKDFGSRHKEKGDSLRNSYEMLDDHVSKRRKDDEYFRRSRSDKHEISHGQREATSHRKRERGDRLEHQKRDFQKTRVGFDDYRSVGLRDEVYVQRDGNERQGEQEDLESSKEAHGEGRERQVAMRSQRGSEERASKRKDEYKDSDKARHSKQGKRRDEDNSSHYKGHADISACDDDIVNNEKTLRQERAASGRSDKVSDAQEKKHKESRRKNKEHRLGDVEDVGSLRSKTEEQNGSFEELVGPKSTKESRNSRHETAQQPMSDRKHKAGALSDDEQQDSRRGRSKLERWTSHKERDLTSLAKSSSVPLKPQEKDVSRNGGSVEGSHDSKHHQDISEEKSRAGAAEMKDEVHKPRFETVEKLKKRSERFKLPLANENVTSTVKKTETETLCCAKIEGPADSEVKAERPARKRRWTSS